MKNHIKSAEFDNLRGVSAVPVSYRAGVLLASAKQDFIWWLQGMSLAEGGFRRLAVELIQMFPERLGTPAMLEAKVMPEKNYPGKLLAGVEEKLDYNFYPGEDLKPVKGSDLIQCCRERALTPVNLNDSRFPENAISIEQFLTDLCINPKVIFSLPGLEIPHNEFEIERAIEANPNLASHDFSDANLIYFHDIVGALFEYRKRRRHTVRESFYVTSIGRKIWDTLDFAMRTRGMVLIYGREGRGKSEAVKAWVDLHSGQARLVSLKGIATKTAAFREIAAVLGISCSYNITGAELQAKIEDVLKRSKIMLVIDEAHFLFNQSQRTKTRPELIDWIDTAFANRGLPLALCSTPQFMDCMARAAYQVEWNYNQFRRRLKRVTDLPEENTEADIAGVAANVFAGANSAVIKKVVSYVFISGRDLSALGDVALELRDILGSADLSKATFKQVDQVIRENLYPSDNAFLTAMEAARQRMSKGHKRPTLAPAKMPHEDFVTIDSDDGLNRAENSILPTARDVSTAQINLSQGQSGQRFSNLEVALKAA